MAPGDVVIAFAGTKERPCVILRVSNDGAIVVVAGTRTAREDSRGCVEVLASSQAGKAMRLDSDTYFYAKIERLVSTSARPTGGRCPPAIFLRLCKLVGHS